MKRSIALLFASCLACAGTSSTRAPSTPAPVREAACAPEDLDGFEDDDGCVDADNDQDGVVDIEDLCACRPEDVDGVDDLDGCPDLDNDGDRRADACDACPNEPETYNGMCDEDGCPDHGHICVEMGPIVILDRIEFGARSARIAERFAPMLDALTLTLQGNPQLERIVVRGAASEDESRPLALAERRAHAVMQALVTRGVDPLRLSAVGEVRPRASARDVRFEIVRVMGEDVDPSQPAPSSHCGGQSSSCGEPVVCPPPPSPIPNCPEAFE